PQATTSMVRTLTPRRPQISHSTAATATYVSCGPNVQPAMFIRSEQVEDHPCDHPDAGQELPEERRRLEPSAEQLLIDREVLTARARGCRKLGLEPVHR